MDERQHFEGFVPPTSSTTYCPNQFFDVALRHGSRGAVRLVAYLIRKTLGWSDAHGRPQEPQAVVSWRELEARAGVGHSSIAAAIRECLEARYITCVRAGRPDRAGEPAASACYELQWDEGDTYVTDPERFGGFFAGNGNLTYIPNQFLDVVVPSESLSVLRVVGAVIRHTIGFQTRYGFRRQEVRMSHAAIERCTNLSHEAVRLAVRDALSRNYLVCLQPGLFDSNAGRESRPATYGIRWRDAWDGQSSRTAAANHEGSIDATGGSAQCSRHGGPLRNVVRERSEPLHGVRSDPWYGKEITGKNTPKQQQDVVQLGLTGSGDGAAAAPCGAMAPSPSSSTAHVCLTDAGFDAATARRLEKQYPPDRIERQCNWLSRRHPHRSRLGMLRRAIEEDWPEPPAFWPDESPSAVCAATFYDGLATGRDMRSARPSAEDLSQTASLLERLATAGYDVSKPDGWGNELARMVSRHGSRVRRAAGSLSAAVAAHADELLLLASERREAGLRRDLAEARRKHRAEHGSAYLAYVRAVREALQQEDVAAYQRFEEAERERRERLKSGFVARSGLTDRMLAAFNREDELLARFALHFAADHVHPVLDFWRWDAECNPHRFGAHAPSAGVSSPTGAASLAPDRLAPGLTSSTRACPP